MAITKHLLGCRANDSFNHDVRPTRTSYFLPILSQSIGKARSYPIIEASLIQILSNNEIGRLHFHLFSIAWLTDATLSVLIPSVSVVK